MSKDILTPTAKTYTPRYTKQQAFDASLEYFGGDDLAASTFVSKYALRNPKQKQTPFAEQTPADMHERLATEIALVDVNFQFSTAHTSPETFTTEELACFEERKLAYFESFDRFRYIVPQGSPMFGIGNPFVRVSISNCVVVESPFDNISGILESGKELANLFKRRCVEENTWVPTRENGLVRMKDVQIGQHVLSFDTAKGKDVWKRVLDKFPSQVDQNKRIVIRTACGSVLRTSSQHPVLTFGEHGYVYRNAGDLLPGDTVVRPSFQLQNYDISNEDAIEAWWIGCHIGDGTADIKDDTARVRVNGDNKAVIESYAKFVNEKTGSLCSVFPSRRKDYKTSCWEFSARSKAVAKLVDDLLDGQFGSKTYSACVPDRIRKKNAWWPFIAGLMDTDGTVKNGSTLVLSLRAKDIVDEISAFLSAQGVRMHVACIEPRRSNESREYRLSIHVDPDVYALIYPWMKHDVKRRILADAKPRPFSRSPYPVSDVERESVFSSYGSRPQKHPGNLASIVSMSRKHARNEFGVGALREFVASSIMGEDKAHEIMQRVSVVSVEPDATASSYWDISVEDTNNFYAGNFGLVNIHNCGVGLDISTLRPDGSAVSNSAGTSTGAWSFSDFYSNVCRMIGQNGRRGALMLTIDIKHPDVDKFTTMKLDLSKVTGANISVRLGDEFMKAVEADGDWVTKWPVENYPELGLVECDVEDLMAKGGEWADSPGPIPSQIWVSEDNAERRVLRKFRANALWTLINECATKSAEPGLLFWDNYCNNLPAHAYPQFRTICVNPCSEIGLSAYDSCRLTSLNLKNFVVHPYTHEAYFDYDLFEQKVRQGMWVMDAVVDLEISYLNNIISAVDEEAERVVFTKLRDAAILGRRTGLGTHGLADALSALRLRYDGDAALGEIERIYSCLRNAAYDESVELAKLRGPFPAFDWEKEKGCAFIQRLPVELQQKIAQHGRRNISILTMAPTGSVSIESQTSSGIEPVFMYFYMRRKKVNPSDPDARIDFVDQNGDKWEEFMVFHPALKEYLEVDAEAKAGWERIQAEFPKGQWAEELGKMLPEFFVQAGDINGNRRVEIQGVIQMYIDHGISSTINLPRGTTVEQVANLYLQSWKYGLKGVTVYVDGSRTGVLVSAEEKKEKNLTAIQDTQAPKRPLEMPCDIIHSTINGEKWTILVGTLGGRPYEIFGGLSEHLELPKKHRFGKIIKRKSDKANAKGRLSAYDLVVGEGDEQFVIRDIAVAFNDGDYAWATRMLSTSLRHGVPVNFLVEQLARDIDSGFHSFSKVMARVLKKYVAEGASSGEACPECQTKMIFQEGCVLCPACGFTKCN